MRTGDWRAIVSTTRWERRTIARSIKWERSTLAWKIRWERRTIASKMRRERRTIASTTRWERRKDWTSRYLSLPDSIYSPFMVFIIRVPFSNGSVEACDIPKSWDV